MSMAREGPRTWKKIRKDIKKLPCPSCVDHGLLLIDGSQDVVNINKLHRPPHDRERFAKYVGEVNSAAEKVGLSRKTDFSSDLGTRYIGEKVEGQNRPSMASVLKGPVVSAYGGSLLAYGIELGIDTAAATFPAIIPGVGPKSLLNLAATLGFAAIGYKTRNKPMISTLSWVASAHHATKIVELIRTGGFPTQFVRPAPFVPAQQNVAPTFRSYGSGGAALF